MKKLLTDGRTDGRTDVPTPATSWVYCIVGMVNKFTVCLRVYTHNEIIPTKLLSTQYLYPQRNLSEHGRSSDVPAKHRTPIIVRELWVLFVFNVFLCSGVPPLPIQPLCLLGIYPQSESYPQRMRKLNFIPTMCRA